MGFFDRFRSKPSQSPSPSTAAPLSDDELRERVFAATGGAHTELCRAHRERILALFPLWAKVPAALREDRAALESYAEGLIAIAQCFAEELEDESLLARLHGATGKNPLIEWQKILQQTRKLIDRGDFLSAIPPLESMVEIGRKLKGTGVDELMPLTLEYLAEARFHSGDPEGAIEPLERALAMSKDEDGKRACARSLFEAYRYRGEFERAAKLPHIDPKDAARVGAGEPLVRVVVVIDGQPHEIDDAPITTSGKVQFAFARNRITLRGADIRTDEGQGLASAGLYRDALTCFEAAAQVDTFEPHCRFLAGLTLVHLERYDEAVARYQEVERLAPGWFQSRFDSWLATQLRDGKLPHAAFLALIQLEDGTLKPDDKRALAEQCIARWSLAAAELHRGRALLELGRHDEANDAFRRGVVTATEPDLRSRLALEIAMLSGDEAAFRKAQDPRGNLLAAAQARYVQRARR